MKNLEFGRIILGTCAAVAMLAACGGSQPPIGAPGVMPESRAITTHGKTTSGELLYASETAGNDVLVFSYPEGGLVQTLTGFAASPQYLCSDRKGDVFVPASNLSSPGYIYEFAHGGSEPIETLTDPGPGYATSCSVDPTTDNLAVANGSNVAVYPHGQGTPTTYDVSDFLAIDCAYDDSGDLFADGRAYEEDEIVELPADGTSFSYIPLSEEMETLHLQWWDNRLVIEGPPDGPHAPYPIFQVRIAASNGIVSGPVYLDGKNKHRGSEAIEFALSDKTLVMPEGSGYSLLNLWHYPKGGHPYRALDSKPRDYAFYGVAISK